MAFHDVCSGDADGLFALRQLRLDNPVESILVTGIKRDVGLLERVRAGDGDQVTVLGIALGPNRDALMQLLDAGATVTWYDRHATAPIPEHPRLKAHIDTGAETCTSLLVDARLNVASARGPWPRRTGTTCRAPPSAWPQRCRCRPCNGRSYGCSARR